MSVDIKADSGGIENLNNKVEPNIAQLNQISGEIVQVIAGISTKVMDRAGVETDLVNLRAITVSSMDAFASTCAGIKKCISDFLNADNILANTMRGVAYNANAIMATLGSFSPLTIGGQIVQTSVDGLNGIFGLANSAATAWTNLDLIGKFNNWVDATKNDISNKINWVVDNKDKLIGTVCDIGAILVTGVAVGVTWVGTGIFTAGTAGVGAGTIAGAVVVTGYGLNNISNRWADIVNRWDNNDANDSEIGNVNHLKSIMSDVGGKAGEAIGGETGKEMGEHIGKAIYGFGEIYSATVSADSVGNAVSGLAKTANVTAIKNVSSYALSRAGIGDNKGETVANLIKGIDPSHVNDSQMEAVEKSVNLMTSLKDFSNDGKYSFISDHENYLSLINVSY